MRRAFGDTMTTIGGLLLVLGLLVAFDDRVRDSMWGLTGAHRSAAEITSAGERARDVLVTVMQVARDQSLDHAPLMIFTLAAMVLVLFMLRT